MSSFGSSCFFKQKTAYVMRIRDWSSDLCSSYLGEFPDGVGHHRHAGLEAAHLVDAQYHAAANRRQDLGTSEPGLEPREIVVEIIGEVGVLEQGGAVAGGQDRKSTRLNSSH